MGAPEFWNDADKAKTISSKAAGLKKKLEAFLKLESRVSDVEEGINLAKEFDDGDLAREALDLDHERAAIGELDRVLDGGLAAVLAGGAPDPTTTQSYGCSVKYR